jgi:polyisoprenoid-binding protein YceI
MWSRQPIAGDSVRRPALVDRMTVARYTIASTESRVTIDATSSVHPIHAETDGLEGWLELDIDGDGRVNLAAGPHAHIELPVDRLRSGNPLEDRELRRRIEARRYPKITGDLASMEETGSAGHYLVGGDVTFKGVTKASQGEVTLSVEADSLRVHGSSVFDIRDFGMEPPRILMLKVSPDVTITIDVVAHKT